MKVTAASIALFALVLAPGLRAQTAADYAAYHGVSTALLERVPGLVHNPTAVLVQFAPDASDAYRANVRALVGDGAHHAYAIVPGLELVHVRVRVEEALARLAPFVEYAEPDHVVRHAATPNDTYYSLQWGLHNTGQTIAGNDPGIADADIDAPEAWNTTTGGAGLVIADLDTGAQWSHPDLAANVWTNAGEVAGNGVDDDGNGYVDDVRGYDFYSNDVDPADSDGHGTHTAGTIGAVGNNGIGVTGVAWSCKVMVLRFLGPQGGYNSDAIRGIQYATQKGVKVSNNSYGNPYYDQSFYNAINAAKSAGHVFVAAAGNAGTNNDSTPYYPAAFNLDNVISVAATDNNDQRASFSNYGASSVDLGAPGVNIASTYTGSNYVYMGGTSMACPHVAAAVGLVQLQNPGWTYAQVRSRILSTVRPVASMSGITVTGGVLNLAAAVGGGSGGNTAPAVAITAPSNGASVVAGASVAFSGSASDAQDGNLSAGLVWVSSLQGQIGTGASFARSDLVVGTHAITASVADSGGLVGSAPVTLQVTSASPVPAAPSSPSATNLGGGQARVAWSDNSANETGFGIERQKRVGNTWTNTTTLPNAGANATSVTDAPGQGKYRYRVRAFNANGGSAWTAWAQVNLN